ncbi:MAG TPA: NAD(P)H-dependent oxidoreductase [Pseudolysinimonas sp.]|nr:NAD(P)H-dependent oxidoreductase [Pseudolysinimonas sp.]
MPDLTALALICTLKPGPAPSSTDKLAGEVLEALAGHGVTGASLRVVDHDVKPGVEVDMGDGDDWPAIRGMVLAADILVLATPTWMGHPSSVAHRVLERLDAELSQTDDEGRPTLFGKVAVVAAVGNEDGAHLISAEVFQALDDVGYTIPAQGVTYWNGPAMGGTDYRDLPSTPEATAAATRTLAANAAHLASLLKASNYPV